MYNKHLLIIHIEDEFIEVLYYPSKSEAISIDKNFSILGEYERGPLNSRELAENMGFQIARFPIS